MATPKTSFSLGKDNLNYFNTFSIPVMFQKYLSSVIGIIVIIRNLFTIISNAIELMLVGSGQIIEIFY